MPLNKTRFRQVVLISLISVIYIGDVASQENEYFFEFICKNYSNKQVSIGFYYGNSAHFHGTVKLNSEGYGTYNKVDHEGIYLIVFPDSLKREILVTKPGKYIIRTDNRSFSLTSNPSSEAFNYFDELSKKSIHSIDSLQTAMRNADNQEKISHKNRINRIKKGADSTLNYLSIEFEGTLAGNYFKALQTIDIPKLAAGDTSLSDSARWMFGINYYRDHYLDNITWSDSRLIYTPVIEEKISSYLNKIAFQTSNGQAYAIDSLIKKSNSVKMQEFLLKTMLKNYRLSLNDPVHEFAYIYLIDNYIIKNTPSWILPELFDKLSEEANQLRPTTLGSKAPEIALPDRNGLTCSLREKEANIQIILFWDYSCPSCQKILDSFRKVVRKYQYKDIAVYTIFTGNDTEVWEAWVVKKLHSDWTNTCINGNNEVITSYQIERIPTLFLLDRNQKIIDKGFTVRELDEYLFKLSY